MQSELPWAERQDDEEVALGQYVRVAGVGAVTAIFVLGMPIRRLRRSA